MNYFLNLPVYRFVAFFVAVLCFLSFVDAIVPQLSLYLVGQLVVREAMVKGALLVVVVLGCFLYPKIHSVKGPTLVWLLCIGYLFAEIPYLTYARDMVFVDVLQSYSVYYLLLLIGPALLVFRGRVSQRAMIWSTVGLLAVCASVGIAQYLTAQPILHTESADGAFRVDSWNFFGQVRAFSLFTTALNFGMFCALCGALGVALTRTRPVGGIVLLVVSAVACFTTLTRLSYLVFICACTYALVITFGKKANRGLWHPVLYWGLGIATILVGLNSLASNNTADLQDASSLIERVGQWAYYYNVIIHSSLTGQLLGVGIVQSESVRPLYPMIIDNLPLALVLHVGLVGLVLFGSLLIRMWLFLRCEAVDTQQPFMIAAASLWATIPCAGIFNILFSPFGAVFALAILCRKRS